MQIFLCAVLALMLAGCGINMAVPDTPGAFIRAVQGRTFEPVETLDPRNAMVYIDRPGTRWGKCRRPPSLSTVRSFSGLESGAYTWLELHGGRYEFYARRPLGILFLKTIFEMPLEVEREASPATAGTSVAAIPPRSGAPARAR